MAVYVDPLFVWPADAYRGAGAAQARRVGERYGHRWCHLFADEAAGNELHELAAKIGMRHEWFQGDHYDLTPGKRAAALFAGAKPVDQRRAVAIWNAQKQVNPVRAGHPVTKENKNMASTSNSTQGKKMDYKQVDFDVTVIEPDAPAGEWEATIPRGKCKVQPTKEDHYPMLIVPIRLDKTEDDDEVHEKALGAELSVMIVFFGNEKARAARMSKLRLRQLCEAADVDLDVIPKALKDPENDLEPLIRAIEGKKIKVWTKLTTRKDTGETVTDVLLANPKAALTTKGDDDEGDDDDAPARPAKGGKGRAARR